MIMKKTKWMSVALSATMGLSCVFAAGCSRDDGGEEYDPNRIQIECAIADVGMGTEWLYNLKYRFEKDFPKAQVMINVVTSQLDSNMVANTLKINNYDVVYPTTFDSYAEIRPVARNVTDWVQKKVYDEKGSYVGEGGTQSLEDRVKKYPAYANAYNLSSTEGQADYLTFPYYISPYGCWYDVDLFEQEGYFELEYEGIDGVKGTDDDTWGADGVEGTYDDMLPATFDDYKTLIRAIVDSGNTPFTWSGEHKWMRTFYMDTIFASYEGVEDCLLNYTLNGVDEQSDIGTVTKADSYKLINQNGRKAMLAMAKFMTSNTEYFSGEAFNTGLSHLGAQQDFLGSATNPNGKKRIAMLLDGSWWENEAKAYMNEMASKTNAKYKHGVRRFGYLPVPFFEEDASIGLARQESATPVVRIGRGSSMIVNAKVNKATEEKQELVEAFMHYSQSYESIADFTATTGVVRPVEANFTKEDEAKFTYMAKNLAQLVNDSEWLVTTAEIDAWKSKCSSLYGEWFVTSKIGNKSYSDPLETFAKNPNLTVLQYFDGMKESVTSEQWYYTIGE